MAYFYTKGQEGNPKICQGSGRRQMIILEQGTQEIAKMRRAQLYILKMGMEQKKSSGSKNKIKRQHIKVKREQ